MVSGNHPENLFTPTSWEQLSSFVASIAATACTVSENPCTKSCCGICSCGSCITPVNCAAPDICTTVAIDPLSQCCASAPVVCSSKACNDNTCDKTQGCTYTPVQCPQLNNCSDYSCDTAQDVCVGTPNGKCVPPPECTVDAKCDDNRPCTVDKCVDTKCVHTPVACTTNKCVTATCNTKTGKCDQVFTNCDDRDPCTSDSCDDTKGCVNTPITCPPRQDKCEVAICDKLLGCTFERKNCSHYTTSNCTIWTCDAGTCKNVSVCLPPPADSGSEVVQAVAISLGAAALVGIIIAIVAVLGACAGGGAYAYAQAGEHSAATQVANNPLYQGTEVNTQNPLFKAH
uniref:Disintegrin domain-containing protein n=1 Tax=Arcella intermedia TaxID=1963864 RepID=A0A6B2L8H3_9EUKA